MGVRSFLMLRVGAVAGVLVHGRGFAQFAALENREDGHAAAIVIGHQDVFPGLVERHMARPGAVRRDLVEEGQLA